MKEQDFLSDLNIDAGVKVEKAMMFTRKWVETVVLARDGSDFVAAVWPGIPISDVLNQDAVKVVLADKYRVFFIDQGIEGFWNDI